MISEYVLFSIQRFVCLLVVGSIFMFCPDLPARPALGEVAIDAEEFRQLDSFEGFELAKADQAFAKKQYRQATSEYEAFTLKYPKSKATAYAVFRRARSLQLDNKRFEAIKAYREVLDYFPNLVYYAAPALFQIGECHALNGDIPQALKAWTEMAADKEYRRDPLAAIAIFQLAENLAKQGRGPESVKYYSQVAEDFRRANPAQAMLAIGRVIGYYVRIEPDEASLRAFYNKVGTFEQTPAKPDDVNYWRRVNEAVSGAAPFEISKDGQAARVRMYAYWAKVLDGKLTDDSFRIDVAGYALAADGDKAKWAARLEKIFSDGQAAGNYDRIMRWITIFAADRPRADRYYAMLDFDKMTNPQIVELVRIAWDVLKDAAMAKHTVNKIKFDKMEDAAKLNFARYWWDKDAAVAEQVYERLSDIERGRIERLRMYQYHGNATKGVPLAEGLSSSPTYSKEATWIKADLLERTRKFTEAILAYQAADRQPDSAWRIGECLFALGKAPQALAQFQEIENFFPVHASRAAMRIARYYRETRNRPLLIAALRGIMKKYPKSGESNNAHEELEQLQVKIGGGIDAE